MESNYKKLLGYVNLTEPPRGLEKQIVTRVKREEERLARFKVWIFRSSSIFSFALSLWTTSYLIKNIQESGFWQYFSLIFSGDGVVFKYWRELLLSLAESLPVIGFIVFFTAVGLFIWSITKALIKMPRAAEPRFIV